MTLAFAPQFSSQFSVYRTGFSVSQFSVSLPEKKKASCSSSATQVTTRTAGSWGGGRGGVQ